MTEDELGEFFGDKEIQDTVEEIWEKVCKNCNKLISDSRLFDFIEIDIVPNPNIHEMVKYLIVLDSILDSILSLAESDEAEEIDTRLIFNSKQQILNMKQVANACLKHDRNGYDEHMARLTNQCLA